MSRLTTPAPRRGGSCSGIEGREARGGFRGSTYRPHTLPQRPPPWRRPLLTYNAAYLARPPRPSPYFRPPPTAPITDLIDVDDDDDHPARYVILEFDPLAQRPQVPRGEAATAPPGPTHVTSTGSTKTFQTKTMPDSCALAGGETLGAPVGNRLDTSPHPDPHPLLSPVRADSTSTTRISGLSVGTRDFGINGAASKSDGSLLSAVSFLPPVLVPFSAQPTQGLAYGTSNLAPAYAPNTLDAPPTSVSSPASASPSASTLSPVTSLAPVTPPDDDNWVKAGLPVFSPLGLDSDEEPKWSGWPNALSDNGGASSDPGSTSEAINAGEGHKKRKKDSVDEADEWLINAWSEATRTTRPCTAFTAESDGEGIRTVPPEAFTWTRLTETNITHSLPRRPPINPGLEKQIRQPTPHRIACAHPATPIRRIRHPLPRAPRPYSRTPVAKLPPPPLSAVPLDWRVPIDTESSDEFDLDQYLIPGGMLAFTLDTLMDNSAYYSYHRYREPRRESYVYRSLHNVQASLLQRDIIRSWCEADPSDAQKHAIDHLLSTIGRIVNHSCPMNENPTRQRFHVDVFGSAAWGGTTGGTSADIDLVVIDKYNPQGYSPGFWAVAPGSSSAGSRSRSRSGRRRVKPLNVPGTYNMDRLASYLRHAGMYDIKVISFATTPIVKFRSPSGLQCDIGVNDLGGWYNSSLILAYCNIVPDVLRPMIHALKKWAKAHKVNNPSGDGDTPTMSSYCLTLMAIAFLQHKGMLPNLQAHVRVPERHNAEDTTDCDDVIWVGWGKPQGIKARIGFDRSPPPDWRPARHMNAAEAVAGFFAYFSLDPPSNGSVADYADGERFQYAEQFVSILNGGIGRRAHRLGALAAERHKYRQTIRELPDFEIKARMAQFDAERDARYDPAYMGTGNGSVQPPPWGEKRLIVQDPFIWEKNCAAGMSNKGLERWLAAVTQTYNMLKRDPNATLSMVLRA